LTKPFTAMHPNDQAAQAVNILVAEDNSVNRTLLKKIFEKLGYHADIVQNGIEALSAFEKKYYDLVIMDIEMPGLNGLEVTQVLNNKFKNSSKKPFIIALTANSLQGEREKFLKAGMDDYLPKPFTIEDIESLIQKVRKS
jgi:CheY-like chemotaxis protein